MVVRAFSAAFANAIGILLWFYHTPYGLMVSDEKLFGQEVYSNNIYIIIRFRVNVFCTHELISRYSLP